jgi:hypothetical protein
MKAAGVLRTSTGPEAELIQRQEILQIVKTKTIVYLME